MAAKRQKPLICVRNDSTALSDERVARLIPAIQIQVTEHFEPAWGVGARVRFHEGQPPADAYVITVNDVDETDDSYLGYHVRENGYPEAFVFASPGEGDKVVSQTLSHEVLEMLIDPALNLYAYRPGSAVRRPDRGYFYEVCDAVQSHHYFIDRVKVCNFVYPEWFEHNWKRCTRRFDHLELTNRPFHILGGCYMDVYEAGAGSKTIWGTHEVKRQKRHRRNYRKEFKLYPALMPNPG